MDDLIDAAREAQAAVSEAPNGHPDHATSLFNLGERFGDLFLESKEGKWLDMAISAIKEAVNALPEGHLNGPLYQYRLGYLIFVKGVRSNERDLQEAVHMMRNALYTMPKETRSRATYLKNVAHAFTFLCKKNKQKEHLDEAIQIMQDVIRAEPQDHPDRSLDLNWLANWLAWRHRDYGMIEDLVEAAQMMQLGVDSTSIGDPDRSRYLHDLGARLDQLWVKTNENGYLDEAIRVGQEAVNMAAPDDELRPTFLGSLSDWLSRRYKEKENLVDLEEAIRCIRGIVDTDAMPIDDIMQAEGLVDLQSLLLQRYLATGDSNDVEEAIDKKLGNDVEKLGNLRLQTRYLDNLSKLYRARHLRTGDIVDLENAIRYSRAAIDVVEDDIDRLVFQTTLCGHLEERYAVTGAIMDLEEAILIEEECIKAAEGETLIICLNNQGVHFTTLFSRSSTLLHIEEAIRVLRKAGSLSPRGHFLWRRSMNSLEIALRQKYSAGRDIADLEEALQIAQDVLQVTPESHPHFPLFLNNLGSLFEDRYSLLGKTEDLDASIRVGHEAVKVASDEHPDRAMFLVNLADGLIKRHNMTASFSDMQEAFSYAKKALDVPNAAARFRIDAAAKLIAYFTTFKQDWEPAYEVSEILVQLISRSAPRSLQHSDRQYVLGERWGLVSVAAAVALGAGKGPVRALEFLERGRGILASSIEETRADISLLHHIDHDLAEHFELLQRELSSPTLSKDINTYTKTTDHRSSEQARADRRYHAALEFEKIIDEIRRQPGFDDFLCEPNIGDMQKAAQRGPIIVVNVSDIRCDAILIEHDQIRFVPLTKLRRELGGKSNAEINSPKMLEWLWDAAAKPILDALGFTHPASAGNQPHVWWVLTGVLAKFPLHSAGYHENAPYETVVDRVMSSYSPSVKAIIRGRQRLVNPSTPLQALLVSMEDTPGYTRLPCAKKEVSMLRDLCISMQILPVEPGPRKQDILARLPECTILHFAGHGFTDVRDPLGQSHLVVLADNDDADINDDRESEMKQKDHRGRITVAQLLEINLNTRPPFLAYLSACGTSQTKSGQYFDEAIHLVGACQLAGFRHVVGTLREVRDEMCVEAAKITYEEIRKLGITDEAVCMGLHKATVELRDRWLVDYKLKREAKVRKASREAVLCLGGNNDTQEKFEVISRNAGNEARPEDIEGKFTRDVNIEDEEGQALGLAAWAVYVHYGV